MIVSFLVVNKCVNFLLYDSMTVSSKSKKKIGVMKKIVEEETVIICKRQKNN